jgi:hypothetical protein
MLPPDAVDRLSFPTLWPVAGPAPRPGVRSWLIVLPQISPSRRPGKRCEGPRAHHLLQLNHAQQRAGHRSVLPLVYLTRPHSTETSVPGEGPMRKSPNANCNHRCTQDDCEQTVFL